MNNLSDLVEEINLKFSAFYSEATKQTEKGNKSAGRRARKLSLEIRDLLKEFRALSVKM